MKRKHKLRLKKVEKRKHKDRKKWKKRCFLEQINKPKCWFFESTYKGYKSKFTDNFLKYRNKKEVITITFIFKGQSNLPHWYNKGKTCCGLFNRYRKGIHKIQHLFKITFTKLGIKGISLIWNLKKTQQIYISWRAIKSFPLWISNETRMLNHFPKTE